MPESTNSVAALPIPSTGGLTAFAHLMPSGGEAPAWPRRHGADLARSSQLARTVLRFVRDPAAAMPDQALWQRMGQALNEGDPPADALVAWMHQVGMGPARALFERALTEGLGAVPDAPDELQAFFRHVEQVPDWLDTERLARGVQASHLSGLTGMRVLRDAGLMAGYQASAINQTLLATGALQKGAARRIAETTKWWVDCMAPGGLGRFGQGHLTTLRVRVIHAMVRRQVTSRPTWDQQAWGLPVNQLDMQATYLGFSVAFLLGQRVMGVLLRQQEAEDIMHLWRYLGWLMGVQPQWLCESEEAGRVALYRNVLSQAPADDTTRQLGQALMNEPLHRHYLHLSPRLAQWRCRWDKAVHLSMCRLFVGGQGMRDLGLPRHVMPWYPVLFAPLNLAWHATHRVLPGGRLKLARQGWVTQQAQLPIMFGAARPDIRPMAGAAAQSASMPSGPAAPAP